jgi:hypothetical protein
MGGRRRGPAVDGVMITVDKNEGAPMTTGTATEPLAVTGRAMRRAADWADGLVVTGPGAMDPAVRDRLIVPLPPSSSAGLAVTCG